MFIFNLNVVFTRNFLTMALSHVRFSSGFPLGAGFPREQSHHCRPRGEKPDFADRVANLGDFFPKKQICGFFSKMFWAL
jgi:hypothetical protein